MSSSNNRRDFIKKSLFLAGTASLVTSGLAPMVAYAQAVGNTMRRADRYEDSFIFQRKPFRLARQ